MFNFTTYNPKSLLIPIYQRDHDERKVIKIVAEFDEDSFGVVTVSRRTDGGLYVIDGQHRYLAALKMDLPLIPIRIIEGLTENEEADRFLKLNATKQVSAVDKFKAQVVARYDDQVNINKIVKSFGWAVDSSKRDGVVSAVKALEYVYGGAGELSKEAGYALLMASLDAITQSWQLNADGTNVAMVKAVGKVLARYNRVIDRSRLVTKLRGTTPAQLIGQGIGNGKMAGVATHEALAQVIVNLYNVKLQKNQLPSWEFRK